LERFTEAAVQPEVTADNTGLPRSSTLTLDWLLAADRGNFSFDMDQTAVHAK